MAKQQTSTTLLGLKKTLSGLKKALSGLKKTKCRKGATKGCKAKAQSACEQKVKNKKRARKVEKKQKKGQKLDSLIEAYPVMEDEEDEVLENEGVLAYAMGFGNVYLGFENSEEGGFWVSRGGREASMVRQPINGLAKSTE